MVMWLYCFVNECGGLFILNGDCGRRLGCCRDGKFDFNWYFFVVERECGVLLI